jgi:hypothetical protein
MPRSPLSPDLRLDYIDAVMVTRGAINRQDIADAWGVSLSQASVDIAAFERQHPRALTYDTRGKRYVPRKRPYVSVRGQTAGDFLVSLRIPILPPEAETA